MPSLLLIKLRVNGVIGNKLCLIAVLWLTLSFYSKLRACLAGGLCDLRAVQVTRPPARRLSSRLLITCSFLFSSLSSQLWLILTIVLFVVTFRSAGGATVFSVPKKKPDKDCQPVKRDLLRQRLGTAYNQRYMAMDDTDLHYKVNQLPPQNRAHVTKRNITKRSSSISIDQITDPTPWTCQTGNEWKDLGRGFFPRHVRSVTCSSSTCWFGHFRCRPKHYTIKVLKKKWGECLRVYSSTGSPRYQDYWEEVEKKITVDCECGH